ncbi:MAG: DUF4157 domain-containing protein [Gammaproteobacteria bacterium]|nr:DUF4157 domain-containing protein [Gammaproteobacteria bacterium]
MRAYTYPPVCYPAAKPRRFSLETVVSPQGDVVRRVLGRSTAQSALQPKLKIGAPNDRFEQEADRVADAVVNQSQHNVLLQAGEGVQRMCTECQEELDESSRDGLVQRNLDEEEETLLQPKRAEVSVQRQTDEDEEALLQSKSDNGGRGVTGESAQVQIQRTLKRSGRPLDESSRHFAEQSFGTSFEHVRVHTDREAANSAQAIGSRAYTVGDQIVFGRGEFNPASREGRRLLSHELTHVIQQSGGVPLVQRDFAIEPPRGDRDGALLSAAQVADAIAYNTRFMTSVPDSAQMIELIRDVLGVAPTPAVIDAAFVNAIVSWQASYGLTEDGKLGPRTARPLFREIGAEGEGRCELDAGPRYRPSGVLNAAPAEAGRESASFRFSADFRSAPANGVLPSCCEVRQYIRWNAAAAASFGAGTTVPHAGFRPTHPVNAWTEDRDDQNQRYGHRSGRYSDPQSVDQCLDSNGRRNQAYGHRYRGSDAPDGLISLAGQWQFMLRVLDVCNSNRRVGGQSFVRVNW